MYKKIKFCAEDYIPHGSENAISREELCGWLGYSDRIIRRSIEEAITDRGVLIINVGNGYFIPTDSAEDRACMETYFRAESAKARSIFRRLKAVRRKLGEDENQFTVADLMGDGE